MTGEFDTNMQYDDGPTEKLEAEIERLEAELASIPDNPVVFRPGYCRSLSQFACPCWEDEGGCPGYIAGDPCPDYDGSKAKLLEACKAAYVAWCCGEHEGDELAVQLHAAIENAEPRTPSESE